MDPLVFARLPAWKKGFVRLDEALERACAYHGSLSPPPQSAGQVWLKAALWGSDPDPAVQAAHYAQDQFETSRRGGVECVTTSAVIGRNLAKDQVLARLGLPAGTEADLRPSDFARQTDTWNPLSWRDRLPSWMPLVGGFMHPTLQLPHLLARWAADLERACGRSFTRVFTSYNTPSDLLENLKNDRPVLLHGVWEQTFIDPFSGDYRFDLATLFGGIPHTMPLVMYDAGPDQWWFYDLAYRTTHEPDAFLQLSTPQLVKFWGRHYLANAYTPPFSMTTLVAG